VKKVRINLDGLIVAKQAEWIVLTGEAELVHTSNVNTKEAELVKPITNSVMVEGGYLELDLPAQSVNVVVFDR